MIRKSKYKLTDSVTFRVGNKIYKGKILLVDKYDTFEQSKEATYGILIKNVSEYLINI